MHLQALRMSPIRFLGLDTMGKWMGSGGWWFAISSSEPAAKWKSDTPRKAGGLMNGAASKAVGYWFKASRTSRPDLSILSEHPGVQRQMPGAARQFSSRRQICALPTPSGERRRFALDEHPGRRQQSAATHTA